MIPGGWERNSFYESFLVPKHTLTSAFETPTAAQPSHFWKPLEEFWLLSLACLVGAQHSYMPQSLSFSCKRWKGALLPQRTPRWRGWRRRGDDYVCSSKAAKATIRRPDSSAVKRETQWGRSHLWAIAYLSRSPMLLMSSLPKTTFSWLNFHKGGKTREEEEFSHFWCKSCFCLLMASGYDNGLRLRPNFAEAEAAARSIGKLQILKKESSHPGLLLDSTKERKKKKSGLTSSAAEALLELSEFSFFPSASESLGRRNSEDEDEEEEDIGRTCTQQETPLDTPCLLKDSYRGASFSAKEKGKHLVLENESKTSEDSFKIRFFRSGNAVAILTHLKNCQKLA